MKILESILQGCRTLLVYSDSLGDSMIGVPASPEREPAGQCQCKDWPGCQNRRR